MADHKNLKPKIQVSPAARMTLLAMACALVLPLLWGLFFTSSQSRSQFENRTLAGFPSLSLITTPGQYGQGLDLYLKDHMGFTIEVNRWYRKLMFYCFHKSTVENISVGGDGFVFLTAHEADDHNRVFDDLCQGQVSGTLLETHVKSIETICDVIRSFGHRPVFATAITKPVLYPERLPHDVSDRARQKCGDFLKTDNILVQLQTRVEEQGIVFHYPVRAFVAAKNQPHFYPGQNFHWHGLSTHVFARTLFERLGISVGLDFERGKHLVETRADLKMIGFERTIQTWQFPYGAFGVSGGFNHDTIRRIKQSYSHLVDASAYATRHPLQDRDAIVLSDSFGAFASRDLATGYLTLAHFNIFQLQDAEKQRFFTRVFASGQDMDIIFLFHDGGIVYRPTLEDLADVLTHLEPGVTSQ